MTKRPSKGEPKYCAEAYGAPAQVPLIDRQRRLYAYAEEIELAGSKHAPIRPDLAKWLSMALKNVACGKDADESLGVKPEKRGVRKDGFVRELQTKHANGFVAAATDCDDPESVTNAKAFNHASKLGKEIGTVRKNWNKKEAKRGVTYSLSKK